MPSDVIASPQAPEVRLMNRDDIQEALRLGISDFRAAPRFGLFFGGVYAIAGIAIFLQLLVWEQPLWFVPLVFAFPIVGPFVAIGLYEVSRRLEAGEPLEWSDVLGVVWQQRGTQLPYLAFVVLAGFMIWVWFARLVIALFLGRMEFATYSDLSQLLATPQGLMMLGVGTVVGAIIAFVIFSVTAVSLPLLLERDIDFVTAMITSWNAVLMNRVVMLSWAAIIVGILFVAMVPFFLGLIVALPILGHATWHVYRRAVIPPKEAPVNSEGSRAAGQEVTL
jgi:uncharacterized membrane protein